MEQKNKNGVYPYPIPLIALVAYLWGYKVVWSFKKFDIKTERYHFRIIHVKRKLYFTIYIFMI